MPGPGTYVLVKGSPEAQCENAAQTNASEDADNETTIKWRAEHGNYGNFSNWSHSEAILRHSESVKICEVCKDHPGTSLSGCQEAAGERYCARVGWEGNGATADCLNVSVSYISEWSWRYIITYNTPLYIHVYIYIRIHMYIMWMKWWCEIDMARPL